MDNVLVVVPHQDDEINLIGNCIDNIRKLGNIILVYTSLEKGINSNTRKKEAYGACEILDIKKENIIFLEYPDTPNREEKHFFSEGNKKIVEDLMNIINKYRPTYIFGTDFDYHSDHRMASIALEEAIGIIINKEINYRPIVLKGFCYDTTYYGLDDYKASKLDITNLSTNLLSNCSYRWSDRYSIRSKEKEGFIWNKKVYKALKEHKSQYAVLRAKSIINADNVFWLRRTDNLIYESEISVSSGDLRKLNDFKILDTDDIITKDPYKIRYDKANWIPEIKDNKPFVNIKFKESKDIKYIIIHGSLNLKEDGNIRCNIELDNNTVIMLDKIEAYGIDTKIDVNIKNIKNIKIYFDEDIKNIGISEIEIYSNDLKLEKIFEKNLIEENNTKTLKDIINDILYKIIVFYIKIKRKIKMECKKWKKI